MRIAPIAVAFVDDPIARRLAALADSAITHYDPRCRLACAAFCSAIAAAGQGFTKPEEMLAAAVTEVDDAASALIDLAREHRLVVSVEDNGVVGGVGGVLLQTLNAAGVDTPVRLHGIPQAIKDLGIDPEKLDPAIS